MKRVKVCIFILVILVSISITSLLIINYKCDNLIRTAVELNININENDSANISKNATKLKSLWNDDIKFLLCLIREEKLYSIDESIAKISSMTENNIEELPVEVSTLIYQLEMIKKTEIPYYFNIF